MPAGSVVAPSADGEALARHMRRRAWVGVVLAHSLVGAVLTVVVIVVMPSVWEVDLSRILRVVLPIGWTYYVVCVIFETWRVQRSFGLIRAWLVSDREPTAEEWKQTIGLPRIEALRGAVYWTVLFAVALPLLPRVIALENTVDTVIRNVVVFLLCTLTASFLTYLLVERAMRPVFARANTLNPDLRPKGLGISARMGIALFVVLAPVVGVFNTLVGITPRQVEQIGLVASAAVGGGGLLAMVLMFINGRTITDTLQGIRGAMASVEDGDLDANLPVDESGEFGDVQAGFNQMVAGLRERERLRDVFGRHVGTDVARLAMESDFGSGGQTCDATAMFVDVIGSTGLTQQKDPDSVVAILNRFFDTVVRCVQTEGGYVNKFHGDGALCIFGAPIPQVDHAARGLRVARALSLELAPMGDVTAAIGVSSGSVVAGNVGAIDRYEFTVIGDPVNEASRLSDEAKLHPSHVLVSDRTIQAAGEDAQGWIRGEAIALRGRSQPTITYSPYD